LIEWGSDSLLGGSPSKGVLGGDESPSQREDATCSGAVVVEPSFSQDIWFAPLLPREMRVRRVLFGYSVILVFFHRSIVFVLLHRDFVLVLLFLFAGPLDTMRPVIGRHAVL
jgi:hypothetical protein